MRSAYLLTLSLLVALTWPGRLASAAPEDNAAQTWIFAGQSNMHPGSEFTGFKETLGKAMPDLKLSFITNQRGGNPIRLWGEGQERWVELLKNLPTAPSPIGGYVFYQGESNTDNIATASSYEKDLKDLIQRVRAVVKNAELPFVIVQLAAMRQKESRQSWGVALVRDAQRRVAEADRHVAVVPALDLPVGDLIVHITPEASVEAGRRVGRAAATLLSGKLVPHGAKIEKVSFASSKDTVIIEFSEVEGSLKLSDGWHSGIIATTGKLKIPSDDDKPLPSSSHAMIWPVSGMVLDDGKRIAVRFPKPLSDNSGISWAATPTAGVGPYRRWDMAFAGIADEAGIPPVAFFNVKIEPGAGDKVALPDRDERVAKMIDASEPFQIAINAAGDQAVDALAMTEQAGAPPYRQAYWNTAVQSDEVNLFDSKGRITPVALYGIGSWYAPESTANTASPDARMMRGSHTANTTTLGGLTAGSAYDLVFYVDVPQDPKTAWMRGFTITGAGGPRTIWMTEPAAKPVAPPTDAPAVNPPATHPAGQEEGGPVHDFRGQYIEATADNGYTGNYIVVRDVTADDKGSIRIDGALDKNNPKAPRAKRAWSGLQVIHRAKPKE